MVMSVLYRTLVAGTPLLLGTLGEIVTERSGILNLGVEGMMSVGAITAFMVAFETGSPWLALAAAMAAGALAAAVHAFATVTLRANQVVSGLALTMLGLGVSGLWGKPYIGRPLTARLGEIRIPVLHRIPLVGDLLFTSSPIFFLAIAIGVLLWFLLSRTRWGISVRSVGENPRAAESQGVHVARVQYLCCMIGGALSGLAGANLVLVYSRSWTEGIVAGRGWIVIALTIFALWRPLRAFLGAFLFGGVFVMQYLLQPLGISPNFLAMMPYLSTLLVLLGVGIIKGRRHLAGPAHLGEPYRRGER